MTIAVEAIAEILGLSREELIEDGVKAYLQSELRHPPEQIYGKVRVHIIDAPSGSAFHFLQNL